jgi:hypothetical protein
MLGDPRSRSKLYSLKRVRGSHQTISSTAIGNAYPAQPNYECSSSRILHALPCIVLQSSSLVQQHQVSNVASSGSCVAELYALYTIALRDLYGFLDVIAFTPEANAVGNRNSISRT